MSRKRKSNPDHDSGDETVRDQKPSEDVSPKKSGIKPLPPGYEKLSFAEQLLGISQAGHDAVQKLGEKYRTESNSPPKNEPSQDESPSDSRRPNADPKSDDEFIREQKLSDDDDLDDEEDEGEEVFRVDWDGGAFYVILKNSRYYFRGDLGDEGPYASLDETLRENEVLSAMVNYSTESIDCSELSDREIASRINPEYLEEDQVISINDRYYIYHSGQGLVPQDECESKGGRRAAKSKKTTKSKPDMKDMGLAHEFLRTSQAWEDARKRLLEKKRAASKSPPETEKPPKKTSEKSKLQSPPKSKKSSKNPPASSESDSEDRGLGHEFLRLLQAGHEAKRRLIEREQSESDSPPKTEKPPKKSPEKAKTKSHPKSQKPPKNPA